MTHLYGDEELNFKKTEKKFSNLQPYSFTQCDNKEDT